MLAGDATETAPQICCCIIPQLLCMYVGLRTRRGQNSAACERESWNAGSLFLKWQGVSASMHADSRYHVGRKHSLPTAWPACVSAGSSTKRCILISWLFSKFPAQATYGVASTSDPFPDPSAEFPPSYSIRSGPPNFGHFFLTSLFYITSSASDAQSHCFPVSIQRTCDTIIHPGVLCP